MRRVFKGFLAVGVGVIGLMAPSQALAVVTSDASVANGVLVVNARPGFYNEIRLTRFSGSELFVLDPKGDVGAGPGCVPDSTIGNGSGGFYNAAKCATPTTFIQVYGGDLNDIVAFDMISFEPELALPKTVDGGPGNDRLFLAQADSGRATILGGRGNDGLFGGGRGPETLNGGPGNDHLYVGEGAETLLGKGGIDRISADQEVADKKIDCGPGNNRREHAKVDNKDPKPKSC